MRRGLVVSALIIPLCFSARVSAARPIAIQFLDQANDIPGLWDATIRSEFVQAMNIAAANVSQAWLHSRPVIVSSDIRSRWRLVVVDHGLNYQGAPAAGFHARDRLGPYAVISIAAINDSVGQVFLDGSHELEEMLVDPWINRAIDGWYAEIADPVVCCHYDVTLADGAVEPLNDFVLPRWFAPRAPGPYDFIDSPLVRQPLQPGPDGFKERE